MKRVLLLAAANRITGGGERHIADLMHGLKDNGGTVAIAAPAGGDLSILADSLAIPYFPVEIGSGISLSAVRALKEAVQRFQPEIVHAHGSRAALFARLCTSSASKRVIYTVHGIHSDRGITRLLKLSLERLLRRKTKAFITVCSSDKDKGVRLGILDSAKTTVIHNGVTPPSEGELEALRNQRTIRQTYDLSDNTPVILHIGRASTPKDQVTLLRAFTQVLHAIPQAILAVVISGEDKEVLPLKTKIRDLGIESSTLWLEPREGVDALYADSNVFCLSSLWEGLPYTILEAMSCGCPVVSTNVDGIPEAITSGSEGLLVPPSSPDELSSALILVLNDAEMQKEFSHQGRKKVAESFSLQEMLDATIEVYEGFG